jgi:hypothetical protein
MSEGGIGWIPYFLERVDYAYSRHKAWTHQDFGDKLPSQVFREHMQTCFIDDETGLRNRDVIGMDQICFETDYPHADSTFPHSEKVAEEICAKAGLDEAETYKLLRGNAITAFGLERFGITG